MTKNIYTPHKADRFYDINNNEIKTSYAQNYYDAKYPEHRFYEDSYDAEPERAYGSRREVQPAEYRSASVYRAPRQPKKSHAGLVVATVALTLAVVMSVGTIVFFATRSNDTLSGEQQSSVSTVTTANEAALSDKTSDRNTAEAATKADAPADTSVGTSDAAMSAAQKVYAGHSLEKTAEENVVLVDGERVYMDVKRLAPDGTGNPAHFYANGKTSYGFDWNYDTDNANFVLSCNYNFARQQYDFVFYGTQAGTAHVTVYYNTADNTQVPVKLTVNVDENLNVTQG